MKRLWGLAALVLLIAACTGTQEPPLELLLAVGEGEQVVFYPAGTEPAAALGSWDLGATVLDLARPAGETRLWVLAPDALRAYPLAGVDVDQAPPAAPPTVELPLGTVCGAGTLQVGENHLLVDCGASGVWTVALANPALEPVDRSGDPEGTRYLLGPDDRVVRLRPGLQKFTLVYPNPPGDPIEHEVGGLVTVEALAADWDRQQRLGIAVDRLSDVVLYTWEAGSSDAPVYRGPALTLSGLRWIRPLPSGWLVAADSGYALRRSGQDDLLRNGDFRDAVITPDDYAYLVGPGRLLVLDLLDPNLSEHNRLAGGQARAVAYLPAGP
ncbi:hypothetical protein [Oceanithermus desulfurans]